MARRIKILKDLDKKSENSEGSLRFLARILKLNKGLVKIGSSKIFMD